MVYVLTGLLTACEKDQDGVLYMTFCIPLLCVQWKTPDDGQRICPKHVEFYSKNKFEKLVHVVGFIIGTGIWVFFEKSFGKFKFD